MVTHADPRDAVRLRSRISMINAVLFMLRVALFCTSSFLRKREPTLLKHFWIPACAGMTLLSAAAVAADLSPADPRSGGDFTVAYTGRDAYALPGPALDREQLSLFEQGREVFAQRWVVAPSPFGLWGRGPLSNGEVCTDCHAENGRGRPPLTGAEPMRSMLVRLSIPGRDAHGGPVPDPTYGDQLQFEGVLGKVPAEGEAYLLWRETTVVLADGETVTLRAPAVEFRDLNFGPIGTRDDALPPSRPAGIRSRSARGGARRRAAGHRRAAETPWLCRQAEPGVGPGAASHRGGPLRPEGESAQPAPAHRQCVPRRSWGDLRAVPRRELHQRATRVSGHAAGPAAGTGGASARRAAVLRPRTRRAGAARCRRSAGAAR